MKKFFRFKSLKTKLLFGFGLIIFIFLLFSTFNYLAIDRLNKDTQEVLEEELPLLIADERLMNKMYESATYARGYFLYKDPSVKEDLEKSLTHIKEIEKNLLKSSNSEKLKEVVQKRQEWETNIRDAISVYESGDKPKANRILEEERSTLKEITEEMETLALERESSITDSGDFMIRLAQVTLIILVSLMLVILIISVLIALYTARSITKPIKKVMARMNLLASGDLRNEELEVKGRDEIAQLVTATNEMSKNNRSTMLKIMEGSQTVASQSETLTNSANEVKMGTEQVSTTMEELAAGTEAQANSASDLEATMSTFSQKVEETNENGSHIRVSSEKVIEMTAKGSKLMNSSTDQMNKINHIVKTAVGKMESLDKQSEEISKLVSVIKDVADQTNLLALNAAIEAARAGEHGAGFAVVADEVRKLAEQVALSVNDITQIVTTIQTDSNNVTQSLQEGYEEVVAGTEQISSTSETFTDISGSVTEMAKRITGISENLSELAENNQEVNKLMEEIASVSEESAAGVEETSATAQEVSSSMEEVSGSSQQLAKLAEEMNKLVHQFKL